MICLPLLHVPYLRWYEAVRVFKDPSHKSVAVGWFFRRSQTVLHLTCGRDDPRTFKRRLYLPAAGGGVGSFTWASRHQKDGSWALLPSLLMVDPGMFIGECIPSIPLLQYPVLANGLRQENSYARLLLPVQQVRITGDHARRFYEWCAHSKSLGHTPDSPFAYLFTLTAQAAHWGLPQTNPAVGPSHVLGPCAAILFLSSRRPRLTQSRNGPCRRLGF